MFFQPLVRYTNILLFKTLTFIQLLITRKFLNELKKNTKLLNY